MDNYEKRFKEVLAKAQEAITYLPDPALKKWLENVFPELKKSSFEDIRKAIIHLVKVGKETHFGIDNYDGVKWDEMLAWLDKPVEEINGEDYGIDAVKKLYKQDSAGWSEKDIKMIDSIIEEVRPYGGCPDYPTDEERDYFYNGQDRVEWLERLKKSDNVKWWPSELQIQCLSDAIDTYYKQGRSAEGLTSLLNDLKKYRRGEL